MPSSEVGWVLKRAGRRTQDLFGSTPFSFYLCSTAMNEVTFTILPIFVFVSLLPFLLHLFVVSNLNCLEVQVRQLIHSIILPQTMHGSCFSCFVRFLLVSVVRYESYQPYILHFFIPRSCSIATLHEIVLRSHVRFSLSKILYISIRCIPFSIGFDRDVVLQIRKPPKS
jgi:hypothetical protein